MDSASSASQLTKDLSKQLHNVENASRAKNRTREAFPANTKTNIRSNIRTEIGEVGKGGSSGFPSIEGLSEAVSFEQPANRRKRVEPHHCEGHNVDGLALIFHCVNAQFEAPVNIRGCELDGSNLQKGTPSAIQLSSIS